jgi:hypothetical protein
MKQEGEKDPKRACIVTTEGCEVAGLGYSELSSIAGSGAVKGTCADGSIQQPVNPSRVTRVLGDRNPERSNDGTVAKVGRRPAPRWCLSGISKTQCCRLQKLGQKELPEKRDEEERDRWFNHARPMTKVKQTWRDKRLAHEENDSDSDRSNEGRIEEKVVVTREVHKGQHGSKVPSMEVNMVFTIPTEFRAPEENVAELALCAEGAVFEKPEKLGEHMKPLFIRGHLDGTPVGHMLVDGGASVNIMPLSVFKSLGHGEGDLK